METITWQNVPGAPDGWTYELGVLPTDVSAITLSATVQAWQYPTELLGLSAAGTIDGYCMEYGGQLMQASGCSLFATLPGGAPGATYQFALSEPATPIAKVLVLSYGATGSIGDISYTPVDPPAVSEPGLIGLVWLAAALSLLARVYGRWRSLSRSGSALAS